jgi:hypothetical protein
MAPTPDQQRLLDHLRRFGPGGNDDPDGTVYEDGSVKGGRRAGDSPDDYDSSGRVIEW